MCDFLAVLFVFLEQRNDSALTFESERIHCVTNHWILTEPFKENETLKHDVDLLVVGKYLFCVYVLRFCWDKAASPRGLNVPSLYEMMRAAWSGFMNIKLCRYSNAENMRHKVNINCTLWVYCGNDITRFYWPLQAAQESFIYGIFALCKVCGSKRLIIESLEPKKIILFLKQRLMFCPDDDDAQTIPVPSNIFFYSLF